MDRACARARRHQGERRLRRGEERAGPQRGAGPPARGDPAHRGRRRGTGRRRGRARHGRRGDGWRATTRPRPTWWGRSRSAARNSRCCRRRRRSGRRCSSTRAGRHRQLRGPPPHLRGRDRQRPPRELTRTIASEHVPNGPLCIERAFGRVRSTPRGPGVRGPPLVQHPVRGARTFEEDRGRSEERRTRPPGRARGLRCVEAHRVSSARPCSGTWRGFGRRAGRSRPPSRRGPHRAVRTTEPVSPARRIGSLRCPAPPPMTRESPSRPSPRSNTVPKPATHSSPVGCRWPRHERSRAPKRSRPGTSANSGPRNTFGPAPRPRGHARAACHGDPSGRALRAPARVALLHPLA